VHPFLLSLCNQSLFCQSARPCILSSRNLLNSAESILGNLSLAMHFSREIVPTHPSCIQPEQARSGRRGMKKICSITNHCTIKMFPVLKIALLFTLNNFFLVNLSYFVCLFLFTSVLKSKPSLNHSIKSNIESMHASNIFI